MFPRAGPTSCGTFCCALSTHNSMNLEKGGLWADELEKVSPSWDESLKAPSENWKKAFLALSNSPSLLRELRVILLRNSGGLRSFLVFSRYDERFMFPLKNGTFCFYLPAKTVVFQLFYPPAVLFMEE